jgi:hypothetical protein
MDGHEELLETAKRAINAVFGDTSVSRGQTRESMKELRDEIDTMLEAMDEEETR